MLQNLRNKIYFYAFLVLSLATGTVIGDKICQGPTPLLSNPQLYVLVCHTAKSFDYDFRLTVDHYIRICDYEMANICIQANNGRIDDYLKAYALFSMSINDGCLMAVTATPHIKEAAIQLVHKIGDIPRNIGRDSVKLQIMVTYLVLSDNARLLEAIKYYKIVDKTLLELLVKLAPERLASLASIPAHELVVVERDEICNLIRSKVFHQLSVEGHLNMFKVVKQIGCNDRTYFSYLGNSGNKEIVPFIETLNFNVQDFGYWAVVYAAIRKDTEIILSLLNRVRMDKPIRKEFFFSVFPDLRIPSQVKPLPDFIPVHNIISLYFVCRNAVGVVAQLEPRYRKGYKYLNAFAAVWKKNVQMLELLREGGETIDHPKFAEFICKLEAGDDELLRYTVKLGLGNMYLPCFAEALQTDNISKVKEMVEIVKLSVNYNKAQPLEIALRAQNAEIVAYLLDKGADPYSRGTELLYLAASGFSSVQCSFLNRNIDLSKYGSVLSYADCDNLAPLNNLISDSLMNE